MPYQWCFVLVGASELPAMLPYGSAGIKQTKKRIMSHNNRSPDWLLSLSDGLHSFNSILGERAKRLHLVVDQGANISSTSVYLC